MQDFLLFFCIYFTFVFVVFPARSTSSGPHGSLGSHSGGRKPPASSKRAAEGSPAPSHRWGARSVRASGCVRGARGGAGARTGRSRERSGGGERGGGGGCVPAGPSRARRKERRLLGAARDLDRDPPRGSGRRKRELRGRVSGRRRQWEEQEGGPGAGRGNRWPGRALCVPSLSCPHAVRRRRHEPGNRRHGAGARQCGVWGSPSPDLTKGAWPLPAGGLEIGAQLPGPGFWGVYHFILFPMSFRGLRLGA